MLKQIGNDIEYNESIKEQSIFSLKKDRTRTPGNMILRFGSEFDSDKNKKEFYDFIKESDLESLENYFINQEIQQLFLEEKEELFLSARERLIQKKEKEFVESLGIIYTN
jgi:hypothetical protein